MSKEPVRVLQVVGRMDRGGIETMLMNLYRNIDRNKVQFDFLAHYGREAEYNEEIRSMGGRIFEMPALKDEKKVYFWRIFSYKKALKKFFKEHKEYNVIHGHMTNTASIYMPIAKKYGVRCRIMHSHSTRSKKGLSGILTDILHKSAYKHATDFFACSKEAQYWVYPEHIINEGKVKIFPNSIDAERFSLNYEKREQLREELDIVGKLVVVCVGRFRVEKNQTFLIDVLAEALKIRDDVVFIFAGDGPCLDEVRAKAERCGVEKYTRFLGARSDIPDILSASDAFVLPSLWEGLPVTAIEAQANGLHCVVSEGLTTEMNALNMVEYISLDAPHKVWAQALITACEKPRRDTYEEIKRWGYDINTTAPELQEFYLSKY